MKKVINKKFVEMPMEELRLIDGGAGSSKRSASKFTYFLPVKYPIGYEMGIWLLKKIYH